MIFPQLIVFCTNENAIIYYAAIIFFIADFDQMAFNKLTLPTFIFNLVHTQQQFRTLALTI